MYSAFFDDKSRTLSVTLKYPLLISTDSAVLHKSPPSCGIAYVKQAEKTHAYPQRALVREGEGEREGGWRSEISYVTRLT